MNQIFIFLVAAVFLVGCGDTNTKPTPSPIPPDGNTTTPPDGNTTIPPDGNTTIPPDGNTTIPPSSNEDMILLESYTVYSGDQIVKVSDSTSLRILHIDFEDHSTVTLLEGSATIIRQ